MIRARGLGLEARSFPNGLNRLLITELVTGLDMAANGEGIYWLEPVQRVAVDGRGGYISLIQRRGRSGGQGGVYYLEPVQGSQWRVGGILATANVGGQRRAEGVGKLCEPSTINTKMLFSERHDY